MEIQQFRSLLMLAALIALAVQFSGWSKVDLVPISSLLAGVTVLLQPT
jgi:hypothetical protein